PNHLVEWPRSHHGPITHMLDGRWVATKINWDPVNALRQSFLRTKTRDLDGFNAMMDIRTNSSNNTVYADSSGNIAYYHGNFVPRRRTDIDYSKPVDGRDPSTDWQGLHTLDEIVTVVNPANGWVQNCNSTPFTAAGADSPKRDDYPVYMAPDAENFRGVHAQRVLADVSDLTLDGLLALAYDPYLPGFETLLDGLVTAYDEASAPNAALAPAIDVLRDWDLTSRVDSVALSLAHFYGLQYREDGANPEGLSGMALIDYYGAGSPPLERLRVFEKAVARLIADFGRWDVPWGEINRFQRLDGRIDQQFDDEAPSLPVAFSAGDWGALASFRTRRSPGTRRLYGVSGNSFVAVVEFGDRVRAKTILAGGQHGDPDSPHFFDQAQRYVDADFKDVAYYRDAVEQRATATYQPGKRRRSR
ncbi:MAG: penicillin acylase family protein, partial [Pseudomonadota bacterium]